MIEFESFAVELAHEAARVTLPFFRSGIGHEDKGGAAGFDPVTEGDKQAEAAIRRLIDRCASSYQESNEFHIEWSSSATSMSSSSRCRSL